MAFGNGTRAKKDPADRAEEAITQQHAAPKERTVLRRANQLGFGIHEKDGYKFDFWRAVAIEFLGMVSFLYTTITTIAYNSDGQLEGMDSDKQLLISLAFGLSIYMLVYFAAGLSGGHLNPAVTWSLMLNRRCSIVKGVCYIVAQMLGAVVGTAFAKVIAGADRFDSVFGGANTLARNVSPGQAVFAEVLSTAVLCLAVQIGLSGELWSLMEKVKMDTMLPAAVGTAVVLGHFVLIPIDGCSINPARSFGSSVVANVWIDHWIFWVGPMLGGTVAILLWEGLLRPPQEISHAQHQEELKELEQTTKLDRFVAPTF